MRDNEIQNATVKAFLLAILLTLVVVAGIRARHERLENACPCPCEIIIKNNSK